MEASVNSLCVRVCVVRKPLQTSIYPIEKRKMFSVSKINQRRLECSFLLMQCQNLANLFYKSLTG